MENQVADEKVNIMNKALGGALIILGIYGIIYSYKLFKGK